MINCPISTGSCCFSLPSCFESLLATLRFPAQAPVKKSQTAHPSTLETQITQGLPTLLRWPELESWPVEREVEPYAKRKYVLPP